MRVPFVGPSYTARSVSANAQEAINCFVEMDQSSPRAPVALYGTPGMEAISTLNLPTFPVRGELRHDGYLYVVAGRKVYQVDDGLAYTALAGEIATGSGPVSMASNGSELLIVDGSSGWIVEDLTLTEIADADFPDGVTQATAQDGFFIVGANETNRFWINTTPNVGTEWNALDFASAEGSPDPIVALKSDHRELWIFGTETTEVWVNTGNADFPFERSGNTVIEHGCAAAATVAAMNNMLHWLGSGKDGHGIVFRANGYTPERISNHAMEAEIATYGDISDAFAMCIQMEGHSFYVLTFPSADKTWAYNGATGLWHRWSWRNPLTNTDHRHRANCSAFFGKRHIVGDFETGQLYRLGMDIYSDAGDPIRRLRRAPTLNKDGKRLFFGPLRIDMETGVGLADGQGSDPQLMLRVSNDGGKSWEAGQDTCSIGGPGQNDTLVQFPPTGAATNRVFEISMTDPVKFAVFGAFVDIEAED